MTNRELNYLSEGYILGRKKGGGANIQPLSLEGIKNLNTLANVTIGSYVFEIKEPKLFFSGRIETYYTNDFKSGFYEIPWIVSAIVNEKIAAVHPYGIAENYISWAKYDRTMSDGSVVSYSSYHRDCSDFIVTSISPYISSYHLPSFRVDFACKETTYYDDGAEKSTYGHNMTMSFEFFGSSANILHNFSVDEYFDFVSDYCREKDTNTPIVDIL